MLYCEFYTTFRNSLCLSHRLCSKLLRGLRPFLQVSKFLFYCCRDLMHIMGNLKYLFSLPLLSVLYKQIFLRGSEVNSITPQNPNRTGLTRLFNYFFNHLSYCKKTSLQKFGCKNNFTKTTGGLVQIPFFALWLI